MKLIILGVVFAVGTIAQAEIPTRAQCDTSYDQCKHKPEHMFNKKPCQKARDACITGVASSTQDNTKNRMLNGSREDSDRGAFTDREAAEQRMRDRNGGTAVNSSSSMRDRTSGQDRVTADGVVVHERTNTGYGENNGGTVRVESTGYVSDAQKKAEAKRRLMARQKGQEVKSGSSMRDSLKTN